MEETKVPEELEEDLDDAVELEERPPIKTKEDRAALFQALVFASPDVMTFAKVKEAFGDAIDLQGARDCLKLANQQLASINSPFEMVEQGGGFRFRTRALWAPWVRAVVAPDVQSRRLTPQALETLAIIAYNQPITRLEIENIRGVTCTGPLKSLLDRRLIALVGRADTLGSPFPYGTTREFLVYFGINKVPDDLPHLRELEDIVRANELIPPLLRPAPAPEEGETPPPDLSEPQMPL